MPPMWLYTAATFLGTLGLTVDEVDAGGYAVNDEQGFDWSTSVDGERVVFEAASYADGVHIELTPDDIVRLFAALGRFIIENQLEAGR